MNKSYTLPGGNKAIILDAVGFIGELYEYLYYAFRHTLDEILLADVLLHVRDIAHVQFSLFLRAYFLA